MIKVAGAALLLAVPVLTAGPAGAEPATRFDTTGGASPDLEVGVDIASGLWVGTSVEEYPGNCSVLRFRDSPPQYTTEGVTDMLISNVGQPMTYRVAGGGSIRLGGKCIWVRLGA